MFLINPNLDIFLWLVELKAMETHTPGQYHEPNLQGIRNGQVWEMASSFFILWQALLMHHCTLALLETCKMCRIKGNTLKLV